MTYRQSFTGIGWLGIALLYLGPIIAGFAFGSYEPRYGGFPSLSLFLSGTMTLTGALMVLIGRESYPFEQILPQPSETKSGDFSRL